MRCGWLRLLTRPCCATLYRVLVDKSGPLQVDVTNGVCTVVLVDGTSLGKRRPRRFTCDGSQSEKPFWLGTEEEGATGLRGGVRTARRDRSKV